MSIKLKKINTHNVPAGIDHIILLTFKFEDWLQLKINQSLRDPDCHQRVPKELYFYYINDTIGSLKISVDRDRNQWSIYHLNSTSLGEDKLLYQNTIPDSEELFTVTKK